MIRFLDVLFSFLGLVFLTPFFLIIGFLIKITSKGPIFFKQKRVGLNGKVFSVYKFRSMRLDSHKLGLITIGGKDPRITSIGFFLRKYKIDELPQLINVFIGEMSLVGPRPEVEKYVVLYTDEQRKVLSIRPGITDWASIHYKDENIILGNSIDPEKEYISRIIPDKIHYNLIYINNYNLIQYFTIIFKTIIKIIK